MKKTILAVLAVLGISASWRTTMEKVALSVLGIFASWGTTALSVLGISLPVILGIRVS